MRISDWSSDVGSSDRLYRHIAAGAPARAADDRGERGAGHSAGGAGGAMARPCDPARAGDDPAGQGRGHRLPVEPPHGRLPPGPIDIQSGRMMKLRSIASRRVSSMARRPSDPWVTTVVSAVATHTPF